MLLGLLFIGALVGTSWFLYASTKSPAGEARKSDGEAIRACLGARYDPAGKIIEAAAKRCDDLRWTYHDKYNETPP